MRRNKLIRLFRKLHKWPSIVIAFFAILFAVSGIFLNHRQFFSPIDISRKFLPPNYTYKNWNLAAVRGSMQLNEDSFLMYGNIGVWLTTDNYQTFKDFNQGFPKGIDNRKTYSVIRFNDELFAGTHLGLFKRKEKNGVWKKIKMPVKEDRITDLEIKENELLVLTRHLLLKSSDGINFEIIHLPKPLGYEKKTGLFNTFWELHSGELFGLPGKLAVDLFGLVVILLSVTGLLHFFFPKIIKRRKKNSKQVSAIVSIKKKNLRWHNVIGYVFVFFLLINTFSGMHLRPPLLIAIANKQIGILPGTHLDTPNPWYDKLRRVHWDEINQRYVFSTSDGFYYGNKQLNTELYQPYSQPPVSVMGCNVLKQLDTVNYLVGSFSGMFIWNIQNGMVNDFFSRKPYVAPQGMTRPIAENMVAGLVEGNGKAWWFDYNRGALKLANPMLPEMPREIRKKSPMSIWNVSQEIHTGRIFEHLIGPFYILFVPLAGICVMIVLISGFFIWWMVYRKNKKK